MRKLSLIPIPMLLAMSCSVWAQMSGSPSTAKQQPQQQATQVVTAPAQAAQAPQAQVVQPQQQVQQYAQPQQVQYVPQPQYAQTGGQVVQGVQAAQLPQQQVVTVTGGAAVPVTTVVPVQNQPTDLITNTTVIEPPAQRMTHAQRRAYKAEVFAAQIDSLVRSRSFVFYPNSMQDMPDGSMKYIVADYFYFGLFVDSAEVHLPIVRNSLDYIDMLNFDSPVTDFRLYPFQSGLSITFAMQNDDTKYFVRMVVSSVTGETVLMIASPDTTMRYVGYLSLRKRHDD